MRTPAAFTFAALLLACAGGKDDPPDSPAAESGPDSPGPDSEPLTADDLPPDPSPLTITFGGALNTTLTFDRPTCSSPVGSANLRVFWRGAHPTVLRMDILGDFTGAGSYSSATHNVNVVLQDEAGGSGLYHPLGEGDTAEVEVLYKDDDVAWGSFTVSGLGGVTLTPSTLPIWCPEFT